MFGVIISVKAPKIENALPNRLSIRMVVDEGGLESKLSPLDIEQKKKMNNLPLLIMGLLVAVVVLNKQVCVQITISI